MANDCWSYSTGEHGRSKVRVYERYPGGPLQIEGTGMKRQALRNLQGQPIHDQQVAIQIAKATSAGLEADAKGDIRQVLGIARRRTLGELLTRYHADRKPKWTSAKHRESQKSLREWWLRQLGKETELRHITEAAVEGKVEAAASASGWSARTRQKYMMYMRGAFGHARRKLKWIGEAQDLTGLDFPTPAKGGPDYTLAECQRMLSKAPDVDLRSDVALSIAWDTQARGRAIRHLKPEDFDGELVTFRAAYDKRKKLRVCTLSPETQWKVRQLLARPEVQRAGWLFVGRFGAQISAEGFKKWLWKLEAAAKVPRTPGRGWHSVKRRAAEEAVERTKDRRAVSRQSGTSEDMLRDVYEREELAPKRAVSDAMSKARGA